ncbi:hypothetical protein FC093_21535 [Ilyomonas limi]|uniref:Uncharacterized protein n=1 Tax=Ilyomonas limi TaxID=2575867 RepID=A0A4U3KRD0_9BACT|nr:hypothetical protein [Ilyomonas limi]TKK64840.1 hypothetical protein FC093_21535 [Ilyomonas limi]
MPGYTIDIILNHSITIAAVIGVVRFRKIHKDFYPFLLIVWLAFINESLSLALIYTIGSNTVNANIYVLAEYLLLMYQFYRWDGSTAKQLCFFAVLGIVIWAGDNMIFHTLQENNSVFRIFYSFVIVFFSIDRINSLIVWEKKSLQKNAVFLLCIAFLLYYGYKAFLEVFNMFNLPFSYPFYRSLWLSLSVVNCFVNIIYASAILCIPKKQEFILLY